MKTGAKIGIFLHIIAKGVQKTAFLDTVGEESASLYELGERKRGFVIYRTIGINVPNLIKKYRFGTIIHSFNALPLIAFHDA